MADKINIINQALLLLGEDTIQSLDEDRAEAQAAAVFYDDARDFVLADIKPNFARARSDYLDPTASAPEFGWPFSFQLPQDCILVLGLSEETSRGSSPYYREWRVEAHTLLSRSEQARIRYIMSGDDIQSFMDSIFVKCLAAYLASEMAYALTNADAKVATMYDLYERRKQDNYNINGMESSVESTYSDALDTARG